MRERRRHPIIFPKPVKPLTDGRVLNFGVALDEVEKCVHVLWKARGATAAGREQSRGAGGVVGLLEKEVGDAAARQSRHFFIEGKVERRADDGCRQCEERAAAPAGGGGGGEKNFRRSG